MNAIFPELPTKLGIYSLTRMLGAREDSELYLATQSYVDRAVVIEVLRPECPPEKAEEFQAIARQRAAATLPHVSPVLESASTGMLRYLIQELPKGQPLAERLESAGRLNMEQAFAFTQAVADMYCACEVQGVAANPLTMDSIYMDGDDFYFFSPVVAGEVTSQQRPAQMEGLAALLESILPEEVVTKSNISIIIHWLRNGYGNAALEWQPLASSLSTLRAQKYAAPKVERWKQTLTNKTGMKRRLRRIGRAIAERAVYLSGLLAVTVGAAVAYRMLVLEGGDDRLAAVTPEYVYCGTPGRPYRVQTKPVSIGEYENFLLAWEKMTSMQKKDINEGMPPEIKDHKPLEWREQLLVAGMKGEWEGRNISRESPVGGVSYWNALAYARYMKGRLPKVEQVRVVRGLTGEPLVEEWTSSGAKERFPLETNYIVYPAFGKEPYYEVNPSKQAPARGFRIVLDNI